MTNKTINDPASVTNLADDDTIPNWDTSAGQQVKITALNARTYMQAGLTGYIKADGSVAFTGSQSFGGFNITNVGSLNGVSLATGYILAAGTVALTGDWDIGNGRKIKADEIRARSASGLKLYENSGTSGMFVDNTGKVCFGTTTVVDQVTIATAGTGALSVTANNTTTSVFGGGHSFVVKSSNFTGGLATLMGANDKGVIQVYKNATEDGTLLLNPNGGTVGIGVTTASYPLHVYNASSGRIYIDSDFTTGTCVLSFASGRDLWRPANSNDLYIGSLAGPTPQWVMTSSGLCAIGNQTSPDSLLHVHSATAGSVTAVSGTVLTVESNGNCYMSLLAPSASLSGIYFGSPSRNDGAQIIWDRANDKLLFYKAGAGRVQLSGNSWEPVNDSGQSLGQSGQRWSAVWSANGTIQTSDVRMKQSVELSNLGLDFINALKPLRWTWDDAQYGRIHHGLAAQQVKEVLDEQDAGDFGGYVYDEPTDIHSLRYSEFVAPLINAIQELTNRLKLLEARN